MVDNYLLFGAPQESGPSRGWAVCVCVCEGALERTVTLLPVFYSANATLQHLDGGNAGPNEWAFVVD